MGGGAGTVKTADYLERRYAAEETASPKYRHEDKYLCDSIQNAVLKARAGAILKRDGHTAQDGFYRVRSLYFDSIHDSCYYENEDGIGERDKYRIRIYNADPTHIFLEKKSKKRQMTLKQSCRIDEPLCRRLMNGRPVGNISGMDRELQSLLVQMQTRAMRPAVIVEYTRYPFVEANGNVRVTFDEDIESSADAAGFLEKRIACRPVLGTGMSVLEVKWDEFLPGYIKNFIQLDSLQWGSFSKYYLCRKYNAYGGIRI